MNENERAVRGIYQALASHDAPGVLEALSPDVQFHIPGTGPLAGDHEGIEAIRALLHGAIAGTAGTFSLDPIEILANERYVVSFHHWSASREERSIAMNNFNVWRFGDDGLVAERWEFVEDQAAHDAFWS